jgi:hypothetical protein
MFTIVALTFPGIVALMFPVTGKGVFVITTFGPPFPF